jgi:hypothetical protein
MGVGVGVVGWVGLGCVQNVGVGGGGGSTESQEKESKAKQSTRRSREWLPIVVHLLCFFGGSLVVFSVPEGRINSIAHGGREREERGYTRIQHGDHLGNGGSPSQSKV